MILLIALAVGVLLVAGFHLVYGWVFSNGLHREMLEVQERQKDLGVRVRSVTGNQIELESPEPRQDIGHPGTFGLGWPDGYASVGDVTGARDARIIRDFFPGEDGPPPICAGPLETCPPVEMDGYAFPSDPEDAKLDFSDIRYDTPLGTMSAWLIDGDDPRKWAIHCHGWTAEKRELIRLLPVFQKAGRTSMVIDYRNDPGVARDPTGRYRFGLTEWADLDGAVRHAVAHGANDIILTGCSTGAALVMAYLERSDLADKVSAVVLDSPNIVLLETVRLAVRDVKATHLMKEFGLWIADLRWNIDWEATNYVQRSEDTLRVPALVFHGTSDQVVPISSSRQLEARVPEMVQLVETPAAGHVLSWNADPARYETYLANFLDRF